ncbi:hypothetical protein LXA43DRAFT_1057454 [Ganoderma leucocontextum]|nr:hypothetical protein LXA43DRAFT_1057454 [Ganoderma leucocontextum]
MDFYRPVLSSSSSGGEPIAYPSLVNEGTALPACPPSNGTRPNAACKAFMRRCESIPTSSPSISLTSWVLGLFSIHPASPGFFLLSLILDLAIFYLVQALQFTAGVALLHALYPAEPDYTMTAARSMRIGAAGGAMFVGVLTLRSLLQLACCDPEEDRDVREHWHSVWDWDAVGCMAIERAPDVRYAAFIGISGSVAFGRRTHDMSGLLHAATAALVGYVVISVPKAALSYARRYKLVVL